MALRILSGNKIVDQNFFHRLISYPVGALMVFLVQKNNNHLSVLDIVAVATLLSMPFVFLELHKRSNKNLELEKRFYFFDGFFSGVIICLTFFSTIATATYILTTLTTNVINYGVKKLYNVLFIFVGLLAGFLLNEGELIYKPDHDQVIFMAGILHIFVSNFYIALSAHKYSNINTLKAKELKYINYTNDQLNKKLSNALADLEAKSNRVTSSIQYAKRIQNAFLPLDSTVKQLLPESFIYYQPKDIVSGDFYFVHKVDRGLLSSQGGIKSMGEKIVISAADCTGHGVPGAFMSVIGHNMLIEAIKDLRGLCDPNKLLNNLSFNIQQVLQQDETKTNDGIDMSICVYDPANRILEFSGAKSSVIFIQNGELKQIKGDKLPVGGSQFSQSRDFSSHIISLNDENGEPSPTMVYLFSDGFQDQFGGPKNKKFMIKRFKELLLSIHHLPAEEQKVILHSSIMQWMNEANEEQVDDILVMGFRM